MTCSVWNANLLGTKTRNYIHSNLFKRVTKCVRKQTRAAGKVFLHAAHLYYAQHPLSGLLSQFRLVLATALLGNASGDNAMTPTNSAGMIAYGK
jgi:hypothetical protein